MLWLCVNSETRFLLRPIVCDRRVWTEFSSQAKNKRLILDRSHAFGGNETKKKSAPLGVFKADNAGSESVYALYRGMKLFISLISLQLVNKLPRTLDCY